MLLADELIEAAGAHPRGERQLLAAVFFNLVGEQVHGALLPPSRQSLKLFGGPGSQLFSENL